MKKPRNKAYRPKPIHMPMMGATHDRLSLKLHMSIEALICRPDAAAFNAVSEKIAAMTDAISHMRGDRNLVDDRDAVANALRTSVMALDAIWQRWERVGKVGANADEAQGLRNAAGVLDEAIRRIPKMYLMQAC